MSEKLTVTVEEAAEWLGVSKSTVYEAVRTRQIEVLRFGERRIRIPIRELQRLAGRPEPSNHAAVAPTPIAGKLAEVRQMLAQVNERLMDMEVACRTSLPEEAA